MSLGELMVNPFVGAAGLMLFVAVATHSWWSRLRSGGGPAGTGQGLATWSTLRPFLGRKGALTSAERRIPAVRNGDEEVKAQGIVHLAAVNRHKLYIQHEDSLLVNGPARSGKTRGVAVPQARSAGGSVAVTSTKVDLFRDTVAARKQRGTVYVYDPLSTLSDSDSVGITVLKWSPIDGCEDPDTALRRGAAWAAAQPLGNVKNGDWFNQRSAELLARLLHAAALGDEDGPKTILDVYSWTQNLGNPLPRTILEAKGPPGWDTYLESLSQSRAGETVDSLKMSLAGVLGALASPTIVRTLTPRPHEAFDVKEFLSGSNSLYLLTDQKGGSIIAPVFTMLMDELINTAAEMSQAAPEGFLWPPFRAVLDEVANVAPIPNLDAHMSDSGGRGIQLIAIVQSRAQMRKRWGPDAAEAIRATSTVQLILPGSKESDLTRELETLAGRRKVRRASTSSNRHGEITSRSESTEWEPVLPQSEVPKIPLGTAWMVYRNLPPAKVRLPKMED